MSQVQPRRRRRRRVEPLSAEERRRAELILGSPVPALAAPARAGRPTLYDPGYPDLLRHFFEEAAARVRQPERVETRSGDVKHVPTPVLVPTLARFAATIGVARSIPAERWTATRRMAQAVRAMTSGAPVSLRIVNIPGPQRPLFLEGARLEAAYGKIPLGERGGLGIAITSYDGKLCWGLNADYDLVPDLALFSEAIRESFAKLVRAAAHHETPLSVVGGA